MAHHQFVIDKVVAGVVALATLPFIATRRSVYSTSYLAYLGAMCALHAGVLVLAALRPSFYQGHRVVLILCLRAIQVVPPVARQQVRLNQPPTGSLLADLFLAFVGLRLATQSAEGLFALPWSLWVPVQLAALAGVSNLSKDCTAELLSHPTKAARFARFHEFMRLFTAPLLPQARALMPATQAGQYKAAVVFTGLEACVLLPALLLLPLLPRQPQRPMAPSLPMRHRLKWVDEWIERVLTAICFPERILSASVTAWWLLAVLWAATAAPF